MTDTHATAHLPDSRRRAHAPWPPPKHPYHLVDPSPWPIVSAIAAGLLAFGGILYMHGGHWLAARSSASSRCCRCMAVWWRDVIREATFQGFHTPVVQLGLRYGMALFIASEVMFFSAFFWAFFSSSLFPAGGVWPPKGIHPFDPFELAVSQHADPAAVGNHGDLGASFAARRQPEGADPGFDADRAARAQLHQRAGLRIRARRVQLPLRSRLPEPAASIPRPSSWRPGFTASM